MASARKKICLQLLYNDECDRGDQCWYSHSPSTLGLLRRMNPEEVKVYLAGMQYMCVTCDDVTHADKWCSHIEKNQYHFFE